MTKAELTKKLRIWLKSYIENNLSDKYQLLEVIVPSTPLAKLNNDNIKSFENYSAWEFTPDICAILKNKVTDELKLYLVNRHTSSLSLRDVGEAFVYARLSNPLSYLIISTKGVSNEVNILLVDDDIRNRLLMIPNGSDLKILTYDEIKDIVDTTKVISHKGFNQNI